MRLLRHLTAHGPAYAALQPDGRVLALASDPWALLATGASPAALRSTEECVADSLAALDLLAPVQPSNILGIGLNYRRHAEEGGKGVPARPMWFMKTTGALQHPGAPIVLPATSAKVDYEGELAVVIGRNCKDVPKDAAYDVVLGYTIANDVSARDWQFELGGGQFCHGKSFDTFCPLGPVLVTRDELPDPHGLRLRTLVNGEVRQDWTTGDMVFDVPTLISALSAGRTLPAGTVILTGTPHGVGYARKPPVWLAAGDTVTVEIEGLGALVNPVIAAG